MKYILLTFILLYLAAFGLLILMQGRLIYPLDPSEIAPSAVGESRLQVRTLTTTDQETIIIWTAAARAGQPTIVYFHGNAGNLAARADRFNRILNRGYGVVAMAYRGSSGSTGTPSQKAIRADSEQLFQSLANLLGAHPNKLIYYGESLGTAVAIHLAANHPPQGLILEAPFKSMKSMVAERIRLFPTGLALRDHWDSLALIPDITAPLLVLHSSDDPVVPYPHGEAIFKAAGSKPKIWHGVSDAGHSNHWNVEGHQTIFDFIDGL